MARIVVVYHSVAGHTEVVAKSIVRGAGGVEGVESCRMIPVDEFPGPDEQQQLSGAWDELDAADAIIFGTPTYMGSVSAEFKRFMDDSSANWFAQSWRDKLAAGFTNSGGLSGDKVAALQTLTLFAAQHSMLWVSQGVFYNAEGINRLGAWLGLMTQSDNAPPDQTPPPEDHRTAELFGERVAHAALRWASGKPTRNAR